MARGWPADPRRAGEPQEVGRDGALWVAGAETGTPKGFIRLHLAKGTLWAWWGADRGGTGTRAREAAGLVQQRGAEQGWVCPLRGEGPAERGSRLVLTGVAG